MDTGTSLNRPSFKLFLLVFVLSIPLWILGSVAEDMTKVLPIKLPISSLMAFCPMLAAMILVYKERKLSGVKELLKRAFDHKKITKKIWYIPIIFLMPGIILMSYWFMQITGATLPEPQTPLLFAFISFFIRTYARTLYIAYPLPRLTRAIPDATPG